LWNYLDLAEHGEVGSIPETLYWTTSDTFKEHNQALRAAAAGDARPLAKLLQGYSSVDPWTIMAAYRGKEGRDKLVRWINESRWAPGPGLVEFKLEELSRLGNFATVVGAKEQAERIKIVLGRYKNALEDENIALVLTIWTEI
jgi:hypothetical protein